MFAKCFTDVHTDRAEFVVTSKEPCSPFRGGGRYVSRRQWGENGVVDRRRGQFCRVGEPGLLVSIEGM